MGFRFSLLSFVSLLGIGFVLGCASGGVESGGSVGAPAAAAPRLERLPGVMVLGPDRRETSLPVLTRGRPALVALWATWCKSCAQELAELERLQTRVGERAVVVAVAVGEPYDTVHAFIAPRGLRYAQLVDEEFLLSDALGTERVPTTLIVDRDGAVRYAGGALDRAALDALRVAMDQPVNAAAGP